MTDAEKFDAYKAAGLPTRIVEVIHDDGRVEHVEESVYPFAVDWPGGQPTIFFKPQEMERNKREEQRRQERLLREKALAKLTPEERFALTGSRWIDSDP